MKVLIAAEHASEMFGGEALIPFQYFGQLRSLNIDAHLLVHERTKKELLAAFPNDADRLHFVPDSQLNILCQKLARFMPDRLSYFTLGILSHFDTQVRQRRIALKLIDAHQFDVLHEPIPVSPKLPSMMYALPIPVVIGPMNGGMDYPPGYQKSSGGFEHCIIGVLRTASSLLNRIIRGKRQAALLLVANRRTSEALPSSLKHKRILELVENGVDLDRFRVATAAAPSGFLKIIYVGRLVDWKRVDLLLEACALLIGRIKFQLNIVGDGPLRPELESKVQQLALRSYVVFHGWLKQASAAEILRASEVMVLTSMRECGGAVVLEAMASGVPVIATEWGGPTDYVTPETGILVPPMTPEEFTGRVADAIVWICNNSEARLKMGRQGRERVRTHFDWHVKAQKLVHVYEAVAADGVDARLYIR